MVSPSQHGPVPSCTENMSSLKAVTLLHVPMSHTSLGRKQVHTYAGGRHKITMGQLPAPSGTALCGSRRAVWGVSRASAEQMTRVGGVLWSHFPHSGGPEWRACWRAVFLQGARAGVADATGTPYSPSRMPGVRIAVQNVRRCHSTL